MRELCRPIRDRSQSYSIRHWLAKLPEPVLLSQPDLAYWYIFALLTLGQVREALRLVPLVEDAWQASGDPYDRALLLSCKSLLAAHQGQPDRVLELLYRRLPDIPPDRFVDLLHVWSGICEWEFLRGNDEVAEDAYRKAVEVRAHLPAIQRWWTVHTQMVRSNHYAIRGDLETAERLYCHELANLSAEHRDAQARYRHRLAAIALEWGDLERARAEAERIVPDLENFPWQFWFPEAWLAVAQVARATGEDAAAHQTLSRVLGFANEVGETHIANRARALQASWWVEEGEVRLARAWAESVHAAGPAWAHVFGEVSVPETVIQLRIAEGAFPAALELVRHAIREGTEKKRWAELVRLFSWEVAAQLGLDDAPAARSALRSALRLGLPGRFARSFFPPGTQLEPFYRAALATLDQPEAVYLERLLAGRPLRRERRSPRRPPSRSGAVCLARASARCSP
jgi:ATP/maltotriose-dependent transcriptional regulator MalT